MTGFLEEYRRVSRREPCPVCDTWDHGCLIHNRSGQIACAKIESSRPMRTAPPTWLHGEDEPDWRESGFAVRTSKMDFPTATAPPVDVVLVDRGLRALLAACPLADEHRRQLHGRGLSAEDIAALPLGSLAGDTARERAARAIVAELGEAAYGAIPGLYRRFGQPTLAGSPGLLIGVRRHGELVGIQIRPDTPTSGKYVWLSSPTDRFPDGRGSGAPAAALPGEGGRCVLIEGILKGLIVHCWSGLPVVALPGVGITGGVVDLLRELGGVETVLTAVDWDRETKPEVAAAEAGLIRTVRAGGFRVERLTWPRRFKGLDDALARHALAFTEPLGAPVADAGRHVRLMRAIQSTGLSAAEKQTIIAITRHLDGAKRDAPDETEFAVANTHISEHVGVGPQTAGRHLESCQRLMDPETGEVVELYRRRLVFDRDKRQRQAVYEPVMTFDELIDRLPGLVPIARDGTAQPKRGHGGARATCPDHPDAKVIRRVMYHCAECGREVGRDPDEDAETGDKNHVPPEDRISSSILEFGQTCASAPPSPSDSEVA